MKKLKSEDNLFLRHSGKVTVVKVSDVCLISGLGNYCTVVTKDKSVIVRNTLTAMEKTLPENDFIRINRSTIINLNYIKKISKETSGRYRVVLETDREDLFISQRYAAKVKKIMPFI